MSDERDDRRAVRNEGQGLASALPAGGYGLVYGRNYGGKTPAPALDVQGATSGSSVTSPELRARKDAEPTFMTSKDVIASSGWTGRKSLPEQLATIHAFAPMAASAADEIFKALHDRRGNVPADFETMDALKALHQALGELIRAAERGAVTAKAWKMYERNREKLTLVAKRGGSLTVAAPVALGLAQLLSWLSGVPVGETLLGSVYGALVAGRALTGEK